MVAMQHVQSRPGPLFLFTGRGVWRRAIRTAGALSLWVLAACRPAGSAADRVDRADRAEDVASAALTAPGLPLSQAEALRSYVEEVLDGFLVRRIERMRSALETGELTDGFVATQRNETFGKTFSEAEGLFNAGEELFEFEFSTAEGLGDGMGGRPPNMHRVHRGAHGGPDTTSCRSCHHRGGDDGAGEYPEAAFTGGDGADTYHSKERNPPALLGGGALQVLAREVSAELQRQLEHPAEMDYDISLYAQGVEFGKVRVRKDGQMDRSGLLSIDPDLVVRPFGWKGTHSSLRRFAEEAFQVHHGMQSEVLVQHRQEFGTMPRHTSPATAAIFGGLGDGPPQDPDRDGVLRELRDEHLTAISAYLTLLPLPTLELPRAPDLVAAWQRGEGRFREIGCAGCHKPSWLIKDPRWEERFELDASRPPIVLDLRRDIQRGPKLDHYDGSVAEYQIFPYTDLRRHDMGPELADRDAPAPPHRDGDRGGPQIPASYFLTRPLWGLADTGPYLHDGRAVTLHDAIAAHGGEAAPVRARYLALPPADQRALQVFLLSLTRAPVPEVVP